MTPGSESEAGRVPSTDAIFRDANDGIRAAAGQYELTGPVPFICECNDTMCTQIVRVELAAYDLVRAEPTHFLNAPGHAEPGYGRVVVRGDGYDVVERLD